MRVCSHRLILRSWQDSDRAPFAEMSADPGVMEYLRPLPTRKSSDAWIDYQIEHQFSHGFCMWAVELRSSGAFLGAVGLLVINFSAHFTPAVEVGWRLASAFWGQGFATEAARQALEFGFGEVRMSEIVAHASVRNTRSRHVMSKLGMSHNDADDFDHPRLGESDPLRRQALYRITRQRYEQTP
ncbi:GNAT family N-acetyltransferase [Afipia sp. GAS231]|uniref:GNAT family N-acetyltransferase n=1 Tax=Afipia sp. GAS231 TaxID=1882747 RepID=UPI00087DE5E8|nr:GNAT family N-acetyltransferase [Afipia sp. GAS231]SDO18446.1 ribosomal-protein-alanine N-acetyltransferase [Afipia sp. GAS231]